MRQYYSNNKNYNAILESMTQIRENQLNEMHDGRRHLMAAHGGMHGDEEEMEEGMYEGEHEDDEDAQMEALAEMMDEALMELDQDDDDDQMLGEEEEDGERRARRRARLRNALLIGAGLVATGGLGAAAAMGKLPGAAGQQTMKAIGDAAGNVVTKGAEYIAPKLTAAGKALSGGIDSAGASADELITQGQSMIDQGMKMAKGEYYTNPTVGRIRGYKGSASGR